MPYPNRHSSMVVTRTPTVCARRLVLTALPNPAPVSSSLAVALNFPAMGFGSEDRIPARRFQGAPSRFDFFPSLTARCGLARRSGERTRFVGAHSASPPPRPPPRGIRIEGSPTYRLPSTPTHWQMVQSPLIKCGAAHVYPFRGARIPDGPGAPHEQYWSSSITGRSVDACVIVLRTVEHPAAPRRRPGHRLEDTAPNPRPSHCSSNGRFEQIARRTEKPSPSFRFRLRERPYDPLILDSGSTTVVRLWISRFTVMRRFLDEARPISH